MVISEGTKSASSHCKHHLTTAKILGLTYFIGKGLKFLLIIEGNDFRSILQLFEKPDLIDVSLHDGGVHVLEVDLLQGVDPVVLADHLVHLHGEQRTSR